MRRLPLVAARGLTMLAAALVLTPTTTAQEVWSGLTKTFTLEAFSDYTLPENQDALTANVILTRADSGGLINFAAESFYTSTVSPQNTLWATDINNPAATIAATNFQQLSFTDWIDAYGGQHSHGAGIVGRNAVVYLTDDNVYLDLKFTSWDVGGGGFSYLRAERPPLITPTGDYNGNQQVDAADYAIWRKTFGLSADPPGSGADGDESGTIDDGDYEFWQQRFGESVGGSLSAAAPEPSGPVLTLLCLLVIGLNCGRKRRQTINVVGHRSRYSTSRHHRP